jgi:hypothetical protein
MPNPEKLFTYTIRVDQDSATGDWMATCWREGGQLAGFNFGPVVGRGVGQIETEAIARAVEDFQQAYFAATGERAGGG